MRMYFSLLHYYIDIKTIDIKTIDIKTIDIKTIDIKIIDFNLDNPLVPNSISIRQ